MNARTVLALILLILPRSPTGCAPVAPVPETSVLMISVRNASFDIVPLVQRSTDGVTWTTVGTSPSPRNVPNVIGTRTRVDFTILPSRTYRYRIMAENTTGCLGSSAGSVRSVAAPLFATDREDFRQVIRRDRRTVPQDSCSSDAVVRAVRFVARAVVVRERAGPGDAPRAGLSSLSYRHSGFRPSR